MIIKFRKEVFTMKTINDTNEKITEDNLDSRIDKFNTELLESIKNITETCDRINADRPMTLEDVSREMERIEKKMLWDKVCENNRKINLLNEKLDMIIEKLGGK